jgi:GNAT superfamily N-acetyltransferase
VSSPPEPRGSAPARSPGGSQGSSQASTPGGDAPASPVEGLVVRALRAGDAEHLVSNPARRALYGEWLARQERGEMYVAVAEVDGVLVGSRCLDLVCGAEDVAYGFGAHVLPEWRRRGVASAMEKHLEAVAIARGKRRCRSRAVKHNALAIRWHEAVGDVCIGEDVARWTEPDGTEVERECWIFERWFRDDGQGRPAR